MFSVFIFVFVMMDKKICLKQILSVILHHATGRNYKWNKGDVGKKPVA